MSSPSAVIPATSTTATLRCPKKPSHTICATWERWTSIVHGPALIRARGRVGLIGHGEPVPLGGRLGHGLARAAGTAFGYPEPVKPLIPMVAPGSISAAAASAGMSLARA